mmetsp:Transcript_9133/g.27483  ORF Transcript_9133/g.27483 Transcript_9133/m.27483 type:complete len:332 (+) Transcript_9133:107-1102(+)
MGRCTDCKQQTQNFCYVHQEFVCVKCLLASRTHGRCVVGSYRSWVEDSAYVWPPKCVICSEEVEDNHRVTRLECLDVAHDNCLKTKVPDDHACPKCKTPLYPADSSSNPIADNLREVLKDAPWRRTDPPAGNQHDDVGTQPADQSANPEKPDSVAVNVSNLEPEDTTSSGKMADQQASEAPERHVISKSRQAPGHPSTNPIDIEAGIVDGTPVGGDRIGKENNQRMYDHDDKEQKARRANFQRRVRMTQKFVKGHRRQIIFLFAIVLCVAVSVIVIGSIIRRAQTRIQLTEEASSEFQKLIHPRHGPRMHEFVENWENTAEQVARDRLPAS